MERSRQAEPPAGRHAADDKGDHKADRKQDGRPEHDPTTEQGEQPVGATVTPNSRDGHRHGTEGVTTSALAPLVKKVMQAKLHRMGCRSLKEQKPIGRTVAEQRLARKRWSLRRNARQQTKIRKYEPLDKLHRTIRHTSSCCAADIIVEKVHAHVTIERQHRPGNRGQDRAATINSEVNRAQRNTGIPEAVIPGTQFEDRGDHVDADLNKVPRPRSFAKAEGNSRRRHAANRRAQTVVSGYNRSQCTGETADDERQVDQQRARCGRRS